jgi:lysophospholipase L1-like esterase
MLGDSFTAGVGVDRRDRFADLFGAGLKSSGKNVTVWNLGAPACGTACEAEMLEYASKEYQLDEVVLVFFGGNDLEDNAAWSATVAGTPPQEGLGRQVKLWLRQRSRLATFLWVNVLRGWATFRPTVIFDKAQLDKFWPDTERALQSVHRAAGAKRLTLLYLPASYEWNDALWETMISRYGARQEFRYVVRDALAEWSRREKVGMVDATDWLKTCRPQSECLFPVDPHWTAKGHFIVSQGLLAEPQWSENK